MRKSGILLSVSSLPGEYGIGDMGNGAFDFVDFLHDSGQSFWQILPLCRTAYGDSPYQSPSVFAGNPYFISLQRLYEDGLITGEERETARAESAASDRPDYGYLWRTRRALTEKAADRLLPGSEYESFKRDNEYWLVPYSLFCALREKAFMSVQECVQLDSREKELLYEEYESEIDTACRVQYLFFSQWFNLKKYANNKGVQIIGDIPIYTAYDSADVFDKKTLFLLNEAGLPTVCAGCPPDAFSPDGQLWGNPMYNWSEHEKENYQWWRHRFAHAQRMYDTVRIDHFRGFYSGYAVKSGSKTARDGRWIQAPGEQIVRLIKTEFPSLPVIAEDLGFITDEVQAFFDRCGFPGMKVMQFSFEPNSSRPYAFCENSVVYTGTHDNMTLCQWAWSDNRQSIDTAMMYYGADRVAALPDAMIRGAMESASRLCIIPMQDWLKKGADARMNTPGTSGENWKYRVKKEELTPELAQKIRQTAALYGRL